MVDTLTRDAADARDRDREALNLAGAHRNASARLDRLNAALDAALAALDAAQAAFDAEYAHVAALRGVLMRMGWKPDEPNSVTAFMTAPEPGGPR